MNFDTNVRETITIAHNKNNCGAKNRMIDLKRINKQRRAPEIVPNK